MTLEKKLKEKEVLLYNNVADPANQPQPSGMINISDALQIFEEEMREKDKTIKRYDGICNNFEDLIADKYARIKELETEISILRKADEDRRLHLAEIGSLNARIKELEEQVNKWEIVRTELKKALGEQI